MFTGITTNLGKIIKISKYKNPEIFIKSSLKLGDVTIGSSIMCSGICLTVIKKNKNVFAVNVSEETLNVTNSAKWQLGSFVNLEKSLKIGDEISGHLVTGHVDGTTKLTKLRKLDKSYILNFNIPRDLKKFICRKGSITLDGVSLTVNDVKKSIFSINLIPHTMKNTTLGLIQTGDIVNIEIDILARYIDQNIRHNINYDNIKLK
tara:strand:+ start:298 stop:912 length:615 start_codon:yes stop_codon:yes gene_type:complete